LKINVIIQFLGLEIIVALDWRTAVSRIGNPQTPRRCQPPVAPVPQIAGRSTSRLPTGAITVSLCHQGKTGVDISAHAGVKEFLN
jgi:hypothetical protein